MPFLGFLFCTFVPLGRVCVAKSFNGTASSFSLFHGEIHNIFSSLAHTHARQSDGPREAKRHASLPERVTLEDRLWQHSQVLRGMIRFLATSGTDSLRMSLDREANVSPPSKHFLVVSGVCRAITTRTDRTTSSMAPMRENAGKTQPATHQTVAWQVQLSGTPMHLAREKCKTSSQVGRGMGKCKHGGPRLQHGPFNDGLLLELYLERATFLLPVVERTFSCVPFPSKRAFACQQRGLPVVVDCCAWEMG